jgi:hypothetical protein
MSVRILSFNAIHPVIKKMFHKCPVAAMGPVRNGIFYFSMKIGVDRRQNENKNLKWLQL